MKEKICVMCDSSFILNGQQGGQNRLFCYNCFPVGLSKSERNKLRQQLLSAKARQEKEKQGCQRCGYNKFGGALDWHHKDANKEGNVADLLNRSWEAYKKEILLCELLCANCHRELHGNIS